MGLRKFLQHIQGNPNFYRTVNIIEEGQKHRELTGEDPVLIINLWTFAHHCLKGTRKEQIVGGRLNRIRSVFEDFLVKLKDNGFRFVFVFKKSLIRVWENDFKSLELSVQTLYTDASKVLDVIESQKDYDAIERFFIENPKEILPSNFDILVVLFQTAKRFGECFATDKSNYLNPCSTHVLLAVKNKAFAIMGTDTHYIFYKGPWKLWTDIDLDIENMTIREYDRNLILASLGLESLVKAQLFVALAGGLKSSEVNRNKIYKYFWSPKHRFESIAEYVNSQRFPISKQGLSNIVWQIFGRCQDFESICKDFRMTMSLMNPHFPDSYYFSDPECSENDLLNYEEYILANDPIYISPIFMDGRQTDLLVLIQLADRWISNTLGIVLKDFKDVEPQQILMKRFHNEGVEPLEVIPNFDNFRILAGAPSGTELLMFIADAYIPDHQASLKNIPSEHLFNIVLLKRMVQENAIKFFEAKLILQTIYDCKNGKIPPDFEFPKTLSARALRVSFLYTKLFFVLQSCIRSIGLKEYQTNLNFDNVYFQKLYEGTTDEELCEEIPEPQNKIIAIFRRIINGLPAK